MQNKTKIVVLHMKELIYTAIFVALAILFIILLIVMFGKKEPEKAVETMADATYVPGIYSTSITLNNQVVDISVTVDENHIKALLGIDDSRISIQRNTNILRNLVSGEGWLLTRITGPGKVFLSSIPSYIPRQQQ